MRIAVYGKGGIGKSTISANLAAALAVCQTEHWKVSRGLKIQYRLLGPSSLAESSGTGKEGSTHLSNLGKQR